MYLFNFTVPTDNSATGLLGHTVDVQPYTI